MNTKPLIRPAIGTALILCIPLVMTFLDRGKPVGTGWHWGPLDFLVMGALLLGAGWTFEVLAARIPKFAHKVALGAMIAFCVVLVWAELAVDAVSRFLGMLFG